MKPIAGSVISSKSISLSEAATIVSRFASSGTGANQDVSAYLRRTSESFDELVRFHQEIDAKQKSKYNKRNSTAEDTDYRNVTEGEGSRPRPSPSIGFSRGENGGPLKSAEGKNRRRETRRIDDRGGGGDVVEAKMDDGNNRSDRKRKTKDKKLTLETACNGKVTGGEGNPTPGRTLIYENGGGDFEEGKNGRRKKSKADERGGTRSEVEADDETNNSERRKKKKKKGKKATPDAADNGNIADGEGNSNHFPSKGLENGGVGSDFIEGRNQKRENTWVDERVGDAVENGEFEKDSRDRKKKTKKRDAVQEEKRDELEVGEFEKDSSERKKKRKKRDAVEEEKRDELEVENPHHHKKKKRKVNEEE